MAAQRFVLSSQQPENAANVPAQRYLELYEIDTDEPMEAMNALAERAAEMSTTASLADGNIMALYTAICDRVVIERTDTAT